MPAIVWWIGGGALALFGIGKAGESAGEQLGKAGNILLIGGVVYIAAKLARGR